MKLGIGAAAAAAVSALAAVAVRDLLQRDHALLRNFPVIGHGRYLIEAIGPELRQYVVAGNNEERPFTRDQRRWVYASAKKENNYFGFGTDNDIEYTAGIRSSSTARLGGRYPGRRRGPGTRRPYRVPRSSGRRATGRGPSGPTRSSTSPA
ncbi:hypothetical protein AB0M20_31605 [Actinoplanes sp. NPDC051633]|uniref:hypothetical protein n=1 Tax=Actinoplanes sp. NPDC051633 TaxID=3155670 RepID=UPI00341EA7B0